MFKRMRDEKGFTLVELLVTVTIIGVLAAVVTVGVSGASSGAQTQANKGLFSSVQSGIDAYAANNLGATGVPVSGAATAGATGYYGADGSTAVTILATDQTINFASTTNSFNTYFRLNNTSGTFACVVANISTFTLKGCHN